MARVAFVMDKLLRKIGLSGRSFVPMLIGFGCSVPAIMATRTLVSDRDRKMTILLTPYMSCSAKIPIYAVFLCCVFQEISGACDDRLIHNGHSAWDNSCADTEKYSFPWQACAVCNGASKLSSAFGKKRRTSSLGQGKGLYTKSFHSYILCDIIIWFLETFDAKLNVVKDSSDSLLALIGQAISPIFKPLGFADWRVTTSLISGFTAKEAVVSTMAVLMNTSTANLGTALSGAFSTLSALSFLVFTLLYTPCVAAVATIKRELDSRIQTVGVVIMQCMVAWLCGCAVYQIGALL